MVVCIALGVDDFRGGTSPPLYIRGDKFTWKVLAEYSWSPTTARSGSFLCTAASSMPIRVVTKDVRYIHELSLTLEHSMPISSPAAPGLTASFKKYKPASTHPQGKPRTPHHGGTPLDGDRINNTLLRKCFIHPKNSHTIFECDSLRKALGAPLLKETLPKI